jgi:hypothetical protein
MTESLPSNLMSRLRYHADECEAVAKERAQVEKGLHYMNTCDWAYAMAFREAAQALGSLPVETNGWQPIETAPKDGRTLLLGYFNSAKKWRTLRGQWFTEGSMDEWDGVADYNPAGWYETSVENDDPPNCWHTEPTHWMPLPKPPGSPEEPKEHLVKGLASAGSSAAVNPRDNVGGSAEPSGRPAEKVSEVRASDPHDDVTVCPPESRCAECWPENGDGEQT